MQIHELKRTHSQKQARQVGRGGKRGKTSGRGTKGQKARAGRKLRPEIRDEIKKVPKLRGYRYGSIHDKPAAVNVGRLSAAFKGGETITPRSLVESGIVRAPKGRRPMVKILAAGDIDKKLTIENCAVSAAAKAKIEKAGGSVK